MNRVIGGITKSNKTVGACCIAQVYITSRWIDIYGLTQLIGTTIGTKHSKAYFALGATEIESHFWFKFSTCNAIAKIPEVRFRIRISHVDKLKRCSLCQRIEACLVKIEIRFAGFSSICRNVVNVDELRKSRFTTFGGNYCKRNCPVLHSPSWACR